MAGAVTEHLKEEFLEYLKKERRYSLHTIRAYEHDIDIYLVFLSKTNRSGIEREDIIEFLSQLIENKRDRRTVSRWLSSLRSFFKFLINRGLIKKDPTLLIRAPHVKKRLPTFLTIESISDALRIPTSRRDRAIMELLYSCGLRAGELVNLNISDVDLEEEIVRVVGKGKKERIIPIGRPAIQAIREHLSERSEANDQALFLSRFGKRLSTRSLQSIVRKYLLQVATATGTNPHIIRHTFATHLLSRGADLRSVQELLGHKSISSTQIYTHVSIEQLIREYKKSHPRAE
ncbi:MAG TPA: tyrosine recombinase XerC [bacterium (Candidatus Stahlbacteria)]|nr:tyrosine recombinase XerC [Candidatus Stahlbacteria bacterium]